MLPTSPASTSQISNKLTSIEAARGIAATMVVCYHAARHIKADYGYLPWYGISQFGHAGVDFFFVLSGFIIYFVHHADIGRPSRAGSYSWRRFSRVYPLFWFALLVDVALRAFSKTPKPFDLFGFLWSGTLFSTNIDVGVAWTLQHEVLFYLFFLLLLLNSRLGKILGIIWVAAVIVKVATGDADNLPAMVQRLMSEYNLEFFFGVMAAYLCLRWRGRYSKAALVAGLASFAVTAILENIGVLNGYASYARLPYGIASMLIILGVSGLESQGRLTAPRCFTEIGASSYSIYLMHLPCIGVVYKVLEKANLLERVPVGVLYPTLVIFALIGGFIVSKTVERSLLSWCRRRERKASTYMGTATG